MSRFSGRTTERGSEKYGGNKGVMRHARDVKRLEARERQAASDPARSKAVRLGTVWSPDLGRRVPDPMATHSEAPTRAARRARRAKRVEGDAS